MNVSHTVRHLENISICEEQKYNGWLSISQYMLQHNTVRLVHFLFFLFFEVVYVVETGKCTAWRTVGYCPHTNKMCFILTLASVPYFHFSKPVLCVCFYVHSDYKEKGTRLFFFMSRLDHSGVMKLSPDWMVWLLTGFPVSPNHVILETALCSFALLYSSVFSWPVKVADT